MIEFTLNPRARYGAALRQSLRKLVEDLALNDEASERLLNRACLLAGWQQMPDLLERQRGEPLQSKHLASLAAASAKLLSKLEQLDIEVEASLYSDCPSDEFSLTRLKVELLHIKTQAGKLASVHKRSAGRPRDEVTRSNFPLLLSCVEEETGKNVGRASTNQGLTDPHLTGTGGKFIMRWFELVDPDVTPSALHHLLPQIRADMASRPDAIAREIKLLEQS